MRLLIPLLFLLAPLYGTDEKSTEEKSLELPSIPTIYKGSFGLVGVFSDEKQSFVFSPKIQTVLHIGFKNIDVYDVDQDKTTSFPVSGAAIFISDNRCDDLIVNTPNRTFAIEARNNYTFIVTQLGVDGKILCKEAYTNMYWHEQFGMDIEKTLREKNILCKSLTALPDKK